ncbi:ABC transporter ATP-binding protein [Virgisporangium aurantiacum]|uniref:ABC transporter ATP-binding protein n=1 Tax=Virgisporangium aurantiacum TaxID=175570 RepID=A0A8J4DZL4_9ACTN|nr:ABC transporter ATP-binding protein [Virgisporangium aurantiacum]GIJ56049.1 ABC transporter ATP-binding protein [Virgisporangium aurantiacum]
MSTRQSDRPAVVARGVHKAYGDVRAVDGVSFTVDRGEFFGVIGPNGAGKTTLIEILEGLRRADTGEVEVLGLSPWPRNPALLPRLGLQTQNSAFFTRLTAIEHLRTVTALYGVDRRRADDVLALVGLTGKASTRVDRLSGGQRQRLAIAAALTHDPELLFFDEPTAAVDPQARRSLWDLLRRLKATGKTIIYTTHHIDEAEALCDRVAIVDQGRLVALDTPRALVNGLNRPTVVRVPADRLSTEDARGIEGVDAVTLEAAVLSLSTQVPGRVLAAVSDLAGPHEVRTHTASLEDVYLSLTGREYQP